MAYNCVACDLQVQRLFNRVIVSLGAHTTKNVVPMASVNLMRFASTAKNLYTPRL